MKKNLVCWLLSVVISAALPISLAACGGEEPQNPSKPEKPQGSTTPETPANPEVPISTSFAKGADVGWLTQLEAEGQKFYDKNGKATECMQLLRDECGVNAIRLRVWVNPQDGWNSIDDVMVKARRAKALGLRLMIDFHFSDTWADPSHQAVPAAWQNYNPEQMANAVAQHVNEMLTRLKNEGITPEWVQIGNETRTGMLWPSGQMKDQNPGEFVRYFNAGYDAVKSVFPEAIVIAHIDNGWNLNLYKWFFDLMKKNHAKYDMIGMSLYPEDYINQSPWLIPNEGMVDNCISNIATVNARYGKPVMLCEIGFLNRNEEYAKKTIAKIMEKYGDGSVLKGIFYWEPEAPDGYNGGYNKGCFLNGRPTSALDPFK